MIAAPFVGRRLAETSVEYDASTRGHIYSVLAGARMLADHPFLGVGAGNYDRHYLRYTNDERGQPRTAHNTFLSLGSQMGAPAMLAFVALSVFALRRRWVFAREEWARGDREGVAWSAAILAGLVAFLVIGMLHSLEIAKYYWMLLALAVTPLRPALEAEPAPMAEKGAVTG